MPSEESTLYGNTPDRVEREANFVQWEVNAPQKVTELQSEGDPAWNRTIQQFPIALPWPR